MANYFIFKGIDCRAMGVVVVSAAPIVRGEEDVEHVNIPGRSGDLTLTKGKKVFKSYIQTLTIGVNGAYNVNKVLEWLTGSGWVTFSGEPERKQQARVIGAVTLTKHSRHLDWWQGEVQFYCDPMKSAMYPGTNTITGETTIVNNGNEPEKPKWTVSCSAGATVVITVGSKSFTVTLTGTSYTSIIIDSDGEFVTDASGATVLTAKSSGDFPVLEEGANTVSGSGWSSITIERRCGYL